MASIYKIEGYIVVPTDDEVDIETLIDNYTSGFSFIKTNECEEFEWDDDLEVNQTDDYYVADELFWKLSHNRAIEEVEDGVT